MNQVWVVEKLVREAPALEVELFTAAEAVNQSIGRYYKAIGRGVRLLEQREAFRQKWGDALTRLFIFGETDFLDEAQREDLSAARYKPLVESLLAA